MHVYINNFKVHDMQEMEPFEGKDQDNVVPDNDGLLGPDEDYHKNK